MLRVTHSVVDPTPELPLIDHQFHPAVAIAGLVKDGDRRGDLSLRHSCLHHDFDEGLTRAFPTAVERYEIKKVTSVLKKRDHGLPGGQRRSADPYVLVCDEHHFRSFPDKRAPFSGSLELHLPWRQILIADAPISHIMRLRITIGDSLTTPLADI